jgi:HAD superfamily phosphatase
MKAIAVIFDIDGVVRDVGGSYRRALADTVEHFTGGEYRPTQTDIDTLKNEGIWNNDWEASRELTYRYFERKHSSVESSELTSHPSLRADLNLNYEAMVAFFQSRYRGSDPTHWTGYICQEPLLMQSAYLDSLTQAGIAWGFFSGATTGSARYVLEYRLGLRSPILVAMEDAPSKPDPTGLLATLNQLETSGTIPIVLYVGDTVADMYTVINARQQYPDRHWIGIGVLPPHVHEPIERRDKYADTLKQAGAEIVLRNVEELVPEKIWRLVRSEG